MRQGSNPKRLRGRTGRKNPHSRSQTFESNGPEVKVRGNAQQVVEKYLALARDASSAGDRITAESYFQHAEHYYRVMTANGGPDDRNRQNGEGEYRGEHSEGGPIEMIGHGGARVEAGENGVHGGRGGSPNGANGSGAGAVPEDAAQEPQPQE